MEKVGGIGESYPVPFAKKLSSVCHIHLLYCLLCVPCTAGPSSRRCTSLSDNSLENEGVDSLLLALLFMTIDTSIRCTQVFQAPTSPQVLSF